MDFGITIISSCHIIAMAMRIAVVELTAVDYSLHITYFIHLVVHLPLAPEAAVDNHLNIMLIISYLGAVDNFSLLHNATMVIAGIHLDLVDRSIAATASIHLDLGNLVAGNSIVGNWHLHTNQVADLEYQAIDTINIVDLCNHQNVICKPDLGNSNQSHFDQIYVKEDTNRS